MTNYVIVIEMYSLRLPVQMLLRKKVTSITDVKKIWFTVALCNCMPYASRL